LRTIPGSGKIGVQLFPRLPFYALLHLVNLKFSFHIWYIWYEAVGWAAVDNAIFAIGQAVIFCLAINRLSQRGNILLSNETEPLLRGSEPAGGDAS
jgi:hypothetical protein